MKFCAGPQRTHLVQEACSQHGVKALSNALVQPGARYRLQGDQLQGQALRRAAWLGVPRRQGLARESPDLQRPLDALRVVGRQARGSGRVHPCQFGMQGGPALLGGLRIQGGAHVGVG